MPKFITKKTNLDYQNAQPREKPYKITDGDGLFMLVRPSGGKVWQMLYTHGGKN